MFKRVIEYFKFRKIKKKMDMLSWQYGESVKAAIYQVGKYEEFFALRIEDKTYSEVCELFLKSCFIKRKPIEYSCEILCRSLDLYKTGRHTAIALLMDEPK